MYYYDYKKHICSWKSKRIEEDYGKGGFDPIKDKYKHSIEKTTYYDENGEIIKNTTINELKVKKKMKKKKNYILIIAVILGIELRFSF